MTTPTSAPVTTARALLSMAARVEAEERLLKQKLLACARARDCDRLVEALEAWLSGPAAGALRKLDPCGALEVTPSLGPRE